MRTWLTGVACLLVGMSGSAWGGETDPSTRDPTQSVAQAPANPGASKVYIGVTVQAVTPDLAHMFGLDSPTGALVARVAPNGPAAVAGMKVGDIILSLGDQPIASYESVRALVAQMPAGTLVLVRLWRDKRETLAEVTVAAKSAPDH
jgi:S1-C subfamily serine protease